MAASLNNYFSQTSYNLSTRKDAMKSEMLRLSTFDKFPLSSDLSASILSRAGFYYTGVDDEVQCFKCDLKLKDWGIGLVPVDMHKKYSPNCPFINSISDTNESFNINPIAQRFTSLLAESNPIDQETNENTHRRNEQRELHHSLNFTSYVGQPNLDAHNLFNRPHDMNNQQPAILTSKETTKNTPVENNIFQPQTQNCTNNFSQNETKNPGDYRYEQIRLASFKNWPIASIIHPKKLARSGFYYLGTEDRVQCTFCRGILSHWDPEDEPDIEHRKHFENCSFIKNPLGVGNVPLESSQTNECTILSNKMEQVAHQRFATSAERLASFTNFPRDLVQTPEQFAEAGFFYSGSADSVKCFCCDGGLRNWEPNDIPWREHARWFPKCGYLIKMKGENFIKDVQKQYAQVVEPPRPPPVIKSNLGKKLPVKPAKVQEYMNSRIVKAILDMGYDKNLIKKVTIRRLEQLGDDFFPNAESLLDAISEYEDEQQNGGLHDSNTQQNDVTMSSPEQKRKNKKKKNKKKKNGDVDCAEVPSEPENVVGNLKPLQYVNNEEAKKLTEDIQRMKDEKMCKICMDEEVSIVFLKCGHMVCCASCAPSLNRCPICRDPIKGTVKVYLS